MPYYLDNAFLLENPWITVVGCGGTGGFVAEGLCRLFQGREATIALVDHDRVEPHNLLRQNFYAEDVGKFKSQALADRLARAYGRPIGYSVYPFREGHSRPYGHGYPCLPRLRQQPDHRLRRQRRRTKGDGGVPAGRRATLAHRRGQRHQLGAGPRRQHSRLGGVERTRLRGRDLPPAGPRPRFSAPTCSPPCPSGRRTWTARRPSTSPTRTRPSTR